MRILIAVMYLFSTLCAQGKAPIASSVIQKNQLERAIKIAGNSGTLKGILYRLRGGISEPDHKYLKKTFAATSKVKYKISKAASGGWYIKTKNRSAHLLLKQGVLYVNSSPILRTETTTIQSVHKLLQNELRKKQASLLLELLFIGEAEAGFFALLGIVVAVVAAVVALPAIASGTKNTFSHGQFLRAANKKKSLEECRAIQEKIGSGDVEYQEAAELTFAFSEKMKINKSRNGEGNFLIDNSLPTYADGVRQCIHEFRWDRNRLIGGTGLKRDRFHRFTGTRWAFFTGIKRVTFDLGHRPSWRLFLKQANRA